MRKTKFARSARKHRVGQASARFVMTRYRPERHSDDKTAAPTLSWVGDDDRGRELEIVAVDVDDHRTGEPIRLVIHVMPTHLRRAR